MPLHLEIVTAERVVYAEDVDMVVAPGLEGALGILPRHAPLMSVLGIGELRITQGGQETGLAIGGGFLEVLDDRVTVLADSAERADEIDDARAEEAHRRAEHLLANRDQVESAAALEASLRRAQLRLRVSRRRRNVRGDRPTP
ncbi:MAG: F0F1 ATP synthase subunit epsilon [Chloroflexia bacterium]|nr:F0F1 ATP synthase subunit epsilon [Chloroflexia bacterium]